MRFFDFLFSFFGLLILLPVFLVILLFGWMDTGAPLFFQKRLGKNKKEFILVKFRTMNKNTPSLASHLAQTSSITKFGALLRRTKLDELPQLWNVLLGSMSLVGPRPCLPNQSELIQERSTRDIFSVLPGITGLAQIQNIDMSTPKLLASTEAEMLSQYDVTAYFKYLFLTVGGKGRGDAVKQ